MPETRLVQWVGEDERARLDAVAVQLGDDRLTAIGTSRAPEYVLSWSLATAAGWVTDSLQVTACGPGWSRSLSLLRSTDGTWSAEADHHGAVDLADPGLDDPDALANALDCDLGRCPLTNTMPIRRLRLLEADVAETELVMAGLRFRRYGSCAATRCTAPGRRAPCCIAAATAATPASSRSIPTAW